MTTSIKVLLDAAKSLNLPVSLEDEDGAVASIAFGTKKHLVINNILGVNYDNEARLLRDKFRCYEYLKGRVKQPKTKMFLDPEYTNNKTVTLGKITKMITKEFETPVMVKRNSGTQKRNVFLCRSEEEIKQALKKIYSKKQLEYDHVALAQGYIQPSMELRVVVYLGEVEFWYPTKGYTESNWLKEEVNTITNISQEVAKGLGATLMGIDLIKDKEGEWWFIEANANPIFSGFMRRNPTSKAVYFLYRKILFSLKNRYQLV